MAPLCAPFSLTIVEAGINRGPKPISGPEHDVTEASRYFNESKMNFWSEQTY